MWSLAEVRQGQFDRARLGAGMLLGVLFQLPSNGRLQLEVFGNFRGLAHAKQIHANTRVYQQLFFRVETKSQKTRASIEENPPKYFSEARQSAQSAWP